MNAQPQVSQPIPAPHTVPEPARRPIDRQSLLAALASIRVDSQREPEGYLRDSIVPHGGE